MPPPHGERSIQLSRGPFSVQIWRPEGNPRAILIFGSGDGGWSEVETRFCTILADGGCLVAGMDCRKYAAAAYTQEVLASDWQTVASSLQPRGKRLPVLYGGWSMGASQAVPAAAVAGPPAVGLLLLSAGSRGRYGLEMSDELGIPPKGKGTFALADFAARLEKVRVVQIHGHGDILDSTDWLESLSSPHRLIDVPKGWHDFSSAGEALPKTLDDALEWLLRPRPETDVP